MSVCVCVCLVQSYSKTVGSRPVVVSTTAPDIRILPAQSNDVQTVREISDLNDITLSRLTQLEQAGTLISRQPFNSHRSVSAINKFRFNFGWLSVAWVSVHFHWCQWWWIRCEVNQTAAQPWTLCLCLSCWSCCFLRQIVCFVDPHFRAKSSWTWDSCEIWLVDSLAILLIDNRAIWLVDSCAIWLVDSCAIWLVDSCTICVCCVQSCANHVQHIECLSRATCRVPRGKKEQLNYNVWQSWNRIYLSLILLAEPLTNEDVHFHWRQWWSIRCEVNQRAAQPRTLSSLVLKLLASQADRVFCRPFTSGQNQAELEVIWKMCALGVDSCAIWLVDSCTIWLVGSSAIWLVGSSAIWLVDNCATWLVDNCATWLVDSCATWLVDSCAIWLVDSCATWLVDSCAIWLIDSCAIWLIDSCAIYLIDSCAIWLVGSCGIWLVGSCGIWQVDSCAIWQVDSCAIWLVDSCSIWLVGCWFATSEPNA